MLGVILFFLVIILLILGCVGTLVAAWIRGSFYGRH
jgi:hypothetical protein